MKNMDQNNFVNNLIRSAKSKKAAILLPEIIDPRIEKATKKLKKIGINVPNINDFNSNNDKYIDFLLKRKFTSNWPDEEILNYLNNPINKALVALSCNDVDGVIAGCTVPTSNIIRSAIRIVGVNKGSKWISSIFVMQSSKNSKILTYGDCAVIPEPSSEQLAYIAKDAASFHELLTKDKAKVAFLSFSTNGSASHYRIDKVKEAVKIFSKKFPNILHEGEIQFDAAISPEVSKNKNKDSVLKGEANVFIFPNLDAGNISYKITSQLAGYNAWGPLLQGLNKPVHDLSRSCTVDEIVNIAAITALQK